MTSEEDRLAGRAYIAAHGRRRPSHAVRNDAALLEAAVAVLAEVGWNRFSLGKVSEATGIAKTSVHNRYSSTAALCLNSWERALFPALTSAIDRALRAGLAPAPSVESDGAMPVSAQVVDARADEVVQEDQFIAAMAAFAHPAPEIRAGVELVLASLVDPALAPIVLEPIRQWLRERIAGEPEPGTPNPVHAARATAIVVWAFGLVMFSTRPWTADMDLTRALTRARSALARPADPAPLPDATATHLLTSPFETDDPRIDLVLDNAMASIGTIGYQRTRLIDVATASGVSEAFILQRFSTKLGLLRAVIELSRAEGYQALLEFQERISAEHGPGIAEAVAWRQYLDPRISDRQMLGTETDRLSLFNPIMRDITFEQDTAVLTQQIAGTPDSERNTSIGNTHLDFATGHGLPIVGLLLPESWTLPFNVITEPYLQNSAPTS